MLLLLNEIIISNNLTNRLLDGAKTVTCVAFHRSLYERDRLQERSGDTNGSYDYVGLTENLSKFNGV